MTSARLTSAILDLAERANSIELRQVPARVRDYAALVFADTVGVIMAGTQQPEMASLLGRNVLGIHRSSSRRSHAIVLSPSYPAASSAVAAMINGAAATSLELDEGVRPTGHPSAHIVPAVLAAAQEDGHSGEEVLAAYLSGYEVAARLYQALELRHFAHPHGHLGTIGAAVAVARLRGCSPAAAASAAATLPIFGTWEACYEGATMRNFYTGFGASAGLVAAELSASGFTGSMSSIFGRASAISRRVRSLPAITDPIDSCALRIMDNYLKLHSACALSHSAIDAVASMGRLDPHQIRSIEVETCDRAMRLARPSMGNALSARFSLPYTVAAVANYGTTTLRAFAPDPQVTELASRVTVRSDPAMSVKWPEELRTRVTVNLTTGRQISREVENPLGHATKRPDASILRHKFLELCWAKRATELHRRLADLASERDVYHLFLESSQ